MTAGQMATPYRPVRTAVLAGALAVTFGVGLLAGLVVPRTIGQTAPGASNPGVVATSTGSAAWAAAASKLHWQRELLAPAVGAVAATTSSDTITGLASTLRNMDPELRAAGTADASARATSSSSAGVPTKFRPR